MSTELQKAFTEDSTFASIGQSNDIVTAQEDTVPLSLPEATDAVPQVDLSEL